MTNAEKIQYQNLKYKYEKLQAKFDMLEQENKEMKKDIQLKEKYIKETKSTCDKVFNEIAKVQEEVDILNGKKKEYEKTIAQLEKTVTSLRVIVEDLKAKKIKNSSNSSKSSSTNEYKRVIQNNRVKSDRKKGGQKGREGKTLNKIEKVDKIVDVYSDDFCTCGGKIVYKEVENIAKQLIDISNEMKTIEYRFHRGICEKCGKEYMPKIPQNLANPIQYSENIKTIIPVIKNISNMSVETTQNVFNTLFKGLPISIGWIHKQDKIIAKKCEPIVEKLKQYLELVEVAHADETSLKIGDKLGTCISFSDSKVVVYGMFLNKSKESFDEFGIFQKYLGILVHDHNKTYYMYDAMKHAECNAHITRYLKHVIELFKRKGAENLKNFLLNIYKEKLQAITDEKSSLGEERTKEIEKEYLAILDEWEEEYNQAIKKFKRISKPYKDEYNLMKRLREYKEKHLKFITDFKVPFSNNEAERNLRKIKMKVNVSKRFGELENARNFAIIKTIIETAKKQGKDILATFKEILEGNYDVFDLSLGTN